MGEKAIQGAIEITSRETLWVASSSRTLERFR
jgi:hypothetical protein